MTYQDVWGKGKLIKSGQRISDDRYNIIKQFCMNYNKPFTVLDIGANMCYFGIRLTEDFNKCNVVAFEFHSFEMRNEHVKKYGNNRLMFLKRKIKIDDIKLLNSCCHFDLVLALSVLHHLSGDTSEWIREIRKLSDSTIIEFALTDSKRTAIRHNYTIPPDGEILGYGISHLKKQIERPIVLLNNKRP